MSIALIVSHFNPSGWSVTCRNLLRFMRQQEAEGIPLFVAELAYAEEAFLLPEGSNILQFRTDRKNILWHKENLLNLLEATVPDEYDKLVWVDGDVWFQRLDWLAATEAALEAHAVVQPYSQAVWTDVRGIPEKARHSAALAGGEGGHGGFAWGARRSLWREGPGLFEKGIIGGGDTVMRTAWLNPSKDLSWMQYPEADAWRRQARGWFEKEGGSCAYVEGTVWHEWHGDSGSRDYFKRHERLRGMDIARQVRRNGDSGVLEFTDDTPSSTRRGIRQYFSARQEDSGRIQESDRQQEAARMEAWMDEAEMAVMAERISPEDRMLEFGSGGSTLWLAARVRCLHTVEHHQAWAAKMAALVPENVTLHWRRPDSPHEGSEAASVGQFESYLCLPAQLGVTLDCCFIDGRARVEAALRMVPWLKPGGWLFFHDWFSRPRYTDRLNELLPHYEFMEDISIKHTPQTLAVFRKRHQVRRPIPAATPSR